MLIRIVIWGGVFALCGAVLWEKSSYDVTGSAALRGSIIGLAAGVAFGLIVQASFNWNRRRKDKSEGAGE